MNGFGATHIKREAGAETERDHDYCGLTEVRREASMFSMHTGGSEYLVGVLAWGVSVGSVVVRQVFLT